MTIMTKRAASWIASAALLSSAACSGAAGESGAKEELGVHQDAVIGGTAAAVGALPYQVDILYDSEHHCGGALISDRWVVTAAHCVGGDYAQANFTLRLGERDETVNEGREQERSAAEIIQHPLFGQPSRLANDIALIRLSSPVTLNQWVNTIALPDGRYTSTAALTVSGWGRTNQATPAYSTLLMRAELPPVDQGTCATAMESMVSAPTVEASMICAGQISPANVGACHGDSGGPLASSGSPRRLVGVVSWGAAPSCDRYSVFTRVSDYVPWIRQYAFNEPRISCQGQTLPTDTEWLATGPEAVSARINTSQCAYTQVPEYFTSLGGTQGLELANGAGAILQPTATGFNVTVFRPGGVTPAQAKQWQWNVNWRAVPKNQVNAQLCSGSTTAGSTNWVQAPNGRIYVDVNTSACGVFFTPRYFTSLKGALMTHLMNGVTTVYSPTATGFRMYLQWGLAANPAALTPGLANSWQWHVGWSAIPSLAASTATQCAGSTASGFWNWTQAGTDTIYTDVNTSSCGRTFTPLYFTELRGNGAVAQSSAVGNTTIRNLTPTSFRVYLRHPGLTPLLAGTNQYYLDWSAHP